MGAGKDRSEAAGHRAVRDRRSGPPDRHSGATRDAGGVGEAARHSRHSRRKRVAQFCGAWRRGSCRARCFPRRRRCFRVTSNRRRERVEPMLVDSHCHLDFPDFADDLDGIVARAAAAGIGRIVTISTRVRRLGALLEIAERFPNVYCSVGTHPHHADEEDGIPAERADRADAASQGRGAGRGGARQFL